MSKFRKIGRATCVTAISAALLASGLVFVSSAGAAGVTPSVISECGTIGGNYLCGTPQWMAAAQTAYVAEQVAAENNANASAKAIAAQNAANEQANIVSGAIAAVNLANAAYNAATSATARAAALRALQNAQSFEEAQQALLTALESNAALTEALSSAAQSAFDLADASWEAFL